MADGGGGWRAARVALSSPMIAASLLSWFLEGSFTATSAMVSASSATSSPKVDGRRLTRLVVMAKQSLTNPYPREKEGIIPGVVDLPVSAFTSQAMPAFAEAPGEPTQHGKELMRLLGGYLGQRYSSLLGPIHCDDVAGFADPADAGDMVSAEAFMGGLLGPGRCASDLNRGITPAHLKRLFRKKPDAFDLETRCVPPSVEELRGMLGIDLHKDDHASRWLEVYRRQLTMIQDKLQCCSSAACGTDTVGTCTLFNLPLTVSPNSSSLAMGGALGVASWFAEVFLAQFCNDLPEAGWGLREEQMVDLLGLLEIPRNVISTNIVTSRNLGSELLWELLRALRPATAVAPGAKRPPQVSVYFGHDTSLQYVRQMLGLKWLSAGWVPNLAEPGALLVFEVYEDVSGRDSEMVRLVKIAATPRQQRSKAHLTEVSPPSVSELWVPGCGGIFCRLVTFLELAARATQPQCIRDRNINAVGDIGSERGGGKTGGNAAAGGGVTVGPAAPARVAQTTAAKRPSLGSIVGLAAGKSPSNSKGSPGGGSKVAAPQVESVVSNKGTVFRPQTPTVEETKGGHMQLVFVCVVAIALCGWRTYKKRQQRERGYESLGMSRAGGRTVGARTGLTL
eukprot:TRINITY_DN20989_c0_g1_i1.p1 TRINITY_DN20989_c0_g1~~TRINITY_DN20989_c0_g1_i1.p1  ORF type:complete len:621 (-),score=117.51 TRINITY_DN20989_c0_g1_i1:188-2050(-)